MSDKKNKIQEKNNNKEPAKTKKKNKPLKQLNFCDDLRVHFNANYSLLAIETYEEERALMDIFTICQSTERSLHVMSVTEGVVPYTTAGLDISVADKDNRDPVEVMEKFNKKNAVLVFKSFGQFLKDPLVQRILIDGYYKLSKTRSTYIIMDTMIQLPQQLQKYVTLLDYPLPDDKVILDLMGQIVDEVQNEHKIDISVKNGDLNKIIDASKGLTSNEAENVYAKSVARTTSFNLDIVLSEKKEIIRKSGQLDYIETPESLEDVGGLNNAIAMLKLWKIAFTRAGRDYGLPPPKGVLLTGVPGVGKTLLCRVASNLYNMPMIRLSADRIYTSLVGESEQNLKNALKLAEACSPCILQFDEIDKLFASGSANLDGGVSANIKGMFLTWFEECKKPVFVMGTSNRADIMAPELLSRFTETFFFELPDEDSRVEIIEITLRQVYKGDRTNFDYQALAEASEDFSGREIKKAILNAMYESCNLGLELKNGHILKSFGSMFPLEASCKEKHDAIRAWGENKTVPAHIPKPDASAKTTRTANIKLPDAE